MDILSHGLIGHLIGHQQNRTKKEKLLTWFFGLLPDLFQIPYYVFVGRKNNRFCWIPHHKDREGFRGKYPKRDLLRDIPHSLFSVLPLRLLLSLFKVDKRLQYIYLSSYLSHILVDIFTHTDERHVKYLYPLKTSYTKKGRADARRRGIGKILICRSILGILHAIFSKKK